MSDVQLPPAGDLAYLQNLTVEQHRQDESILIQARPDMVSAERGTFQEHTLTTTWGDTRVMVYHPSKGASTPLPVFVNLHGGGWVLGFPEVDDIYCRFLADEVGCVVVNVDYVLAPEHKFPAAIHQIHALLEDLQDHPERFGIDPQRIAMGGHSAGGNLTASVSLLAQELGKVQLKAQILDYPATDLHELKGVEPSEHDTLTALVHKYHGWYLPGEKDDQSPLASPLRAERLTGLPPALVITADLDLLADQGDRYAHAMRDAGVEVTHKRYPMCVHGFTHVGPQDSATDAWNLMVLHLKKAFGGPQPGEGR